MMSGRWRGVGIGGEDLRSLVEQGNDEWSMAGIEAKGRKDIDRPKEVKSNKNGEREESLGEEGWLTAPKAVKGGSS